MISGQVQEMRGGCVPSKERLVVWFGHDLKMSNMWIEMSEIITSRNLHSRNDKTE